MIQVICPASQATLEQLMLEVSSGVSLDEAAGALGIPLHTALHIMQQNEMEARVRNLAGAWVDAQGKLPTGVSAAPTVSALRRRRE
jgi:hypothetical protein